MTRDRALRVLDVYASVNGSGQCTQDEFEEAKKMPPAQQGRETGARITVDYFADGKPTYREWECSACGCVVEDEKPTWNFCPMCGADMRSERDMYCRKI